MYTHYNIGVITWADPSQRCLNDIVYSNNISYCELHGYTYIDAKDTIVDLQVYSNLIDKDPHYYKLAVLLKYIDKFDYLIWLDSDICICDINFSFEPIIEMYLAYCQNSMWLPSTTAVDRIGCTAIMVVKNCVQAKHILNVVLTNPMFYAYYKFLNNERWNGQVREEAALARYIDTNELYGDTIKCTYIDNLWGDIPIIDRGLFYENRGFLYKFYSLSDVIDLMFSSDMLRKYLMYIISNTKQAEQNNLMFCYFMAMDLYKQGTFCIHMLGHTTMAKYDAMRILVNV